MPVDPPIAGLLSMLAQQGTGGLTNGSVEQARALLATMTQMMEAAFPGGIRTPVGPVEDVTIADVPCRVYRPDGAAGGVPTTVMFHGGGFVIGDLATHDDQARLLVVGTAGVVVSVDYRLAPEAPYPAGLQDCEAVTRYVLAHADEFGGDPARVGVAGDSAGGNLSAVVAQRLRDEPGASPLAAQLLWYPAVDMEDDEGARFASRLENADGYLLTTEDMRWFSGHYLGEGADPADPGASPRRPSSTRCATRVRPTPRPWTRPASASSRPGTTGSSTASPAWACSPTSRGGRPTRPSPRTQSCWARRADPPRRCARLPGVARPRPVPPDPAVVLVPGPWTHRQVGANGARFHVAELGEGPLVLLLHGFPEFWWCWRDQLTSLAAQGFRAVAVDLRGYGGSDKPPRGYDVPNLTADVAGLVGALGERSATIVGHDWGGYLGWSLAVLHPHVVHRLVVVSMPHPLAFGKAVRSGGPQTAASRYIAAFQVPWRPERRLVSQDAAEVGAILRRWGGSGFPDGETEARYREHAQVPAVVHSALEYYRWSVRSQLRPDGQRFARSMERPVSAPTLQLHGTADPCTLAATARGNGRYVAGPYALVEMRGVGHFPHEERPDEVSGHIASWAR